MMSTCSEHKNKGRMKGRKEGRKEGREGRRDERGKEKAVQRWRTRRKLYREERGKRGAWHTCILLRFASGSMTLSPAPSTTRLPIFKNILEVKLFPPISLINWPKK
jgi:hypothetical protein